MESLYRAAHEQALVSEIPQLPILSISGSDAARYLHGRITQDVRGLAVSNLARSLLLTPQGLILGYFYLARLPQGTLSASTDATEQFLLVGDNTTTESSSNFIRALMQFKVADRVDIRPLHDTQALLTIQGPRSAEILERVFTTPRPSSPAAVSERKWNEHTVTVLSMPRWRSIGSELASGFDLLISRQAATELMQAIEVAGATRGNQKIFELLRIEAGIPNYTSDLSDSVLAPEIDLLTVAAFDKGCYVGQEVVEMATARGRPNRRLVVGEISQPNPMIGSDSERIDFRSGDDVVSLDTNQKVGKLHSVAAQPWQSKVIAIAIIKVKNLAERLAVHGHSFNFTPPATESGSN